MQAARHWLSVQRSSNSCQPDGQSSLPSKDRPVERKIQPSTYRVRGVSPPKPPDNPPTPSPVLRGSPAGVRGGLGEHAGKESGGAYSERSQRMGGDKPKSSMNRSLIATNGNKGLMHMCPKWDTCREGYTPIFPCRFFPFRPSGGVSHSAVCAGQSNSDFSGEIARRSGVLYGHSSHGYGTRVQHCRENFCTRSGGG